MRESDMEHAFNVWEQFFLEKEKKNKGQVLRPLLFEGEIKTSR